VAAAQELFGAYLRRWKTFLGSSASHTIDYYDILYFGIADNYGNYDVSSNSAGVVRDFAKLQRGLVFTHDTVANWVNSGNYNPHPNFSSLVDVHGLGLTECPYLIFTKVKLISDQVASPILNSPFKLPASFDTLPAHWGGQTVISGTAWYNGTDPNLIEDYQLYMQTYTNPNYGSHSSFYSYGHTENIPMEWEAKAMINSMYFSYRGSGPTLEFPVKYEDDNLNFAQVALGHVTNEDTGRINSWFDHIFPDYGTNITVTIWNGAIYTNTDTEQLNAKNCDRGVNCYNGHNGIDIRNTETHEAIYPVATGVVTGTVINCTVGITTCGGGYGNQVWIDHGFGYASHYGHLDTVSVTVGTKITDTLHLPLGVMGNTGNSTGIHLHFSLYLDKNKDRIWSSNEVVDPYGWFGTYQDPWSMPDLYLWKNPLWTQQPVGSDGGSLTSPSGQVTIVFPPNIISSNLTVELWDAPPVAVPSASLRSLGHSFWIRVLDWLSDGADQTAISNEINEHFPQPYTITVAYEPSELLHLDMSQLSINRYDEESNHWVQLPTELGPGLNQVHALYEEIGNFDLQAPLLCPNDVYEPDDSFYFALAVQPNAQKVDRLLDIASDEDWFAVDLTAGKQYIFATNDLGSGVRTTTELYDIDGITLIASGEPLYWTVSQTGTYFIKVANAQGSTPGCEASYRFFVNEIPKVFLPMITSIQH
jgi:murein DD-endopeptidase MepM/ murein hydrolase activator NlpD